MEVSWNQKKKMEMEGTSEISSLMVLKSNQAPQAGVVLIMDGFLSSIKEISMYRKAVF